MFVCYRVSRVVVSVVVYVCMYSVISVVRCLPVGIIGVSFFSVFALSKIINVGEVVLFREKFRIDIRVRMYYSIRM